LSRHDSELGPLPRPFAENPAMPATDGIPEAEKRIELRFRRLPGQFAVARLAANSPIPAWALGGEFSSVTRTAEELSIVCGAENVSPGVAFQSGWICFKLEGPFPFSQTGILAAFINPLSHHGVPIFAISTFDTDYVLIQEPFLGVAEDRLRDAGHELLGSLGR
jgi:hypothetical protein